MSDIARAAKRLGLQVEEGDGTAHWKFRAPGKRVYPISAHNGGKSSISDIYIKGLCRHFDLDEQELREKL